MKMLLSYDEDEIGSRMTTNYISIKNDMTIRQAMSELVKQAGENDNISTLYVVDKNEHFYGAIDLKDLIIARAEESLESLIVRSYPSCHRPGAGQRLYRPYRGLRGAQPAGAERYR